MRYVGGKHHIAGWVAKHVLALGRGRSTYLEPFVGSGATFTRHAPAFETAIAADACEDLIALWQALAAGWEPPHKLTRAAYDDLKDESPSPLRGFAGFGASFGGKWFGGFIGDRDDGRDYVGEARASLIRDAQAFRDARILHASYDAHEADETTLVYCDPPYAGTQGYGAVGSFDHPAFWRKALDWHEAGALVVVSEESAPPEWGVYAVKPRRGTLAATKGKPRLERLFVHRSRLAPRTIRLPRPCS